MRLSATRSTPSTSPQRATNPPGVVRVTAVLAPADQKTKQQQQQPPRPEAAGKPQGAARSLTGALFSVFRGWEAKQPSDEDSKAVAALAQATNERAQQADAIEEREKAAKEQSPVPDISAFLRPVGVMEARYVRLLSNLSALTYHLDKLTPSSLLRRHRLKLVSTSKVCELKLREARQSPGDALLHGDAMAAHFDVVAAAQADIAAAERRATESPSPALRAIARVEPLASADLTGAGAAAGSGSGGDAGGSDAEVAPALSPVELVGAKLAAAAAAASAAAQGVYSAAGSYTGPLANNIIGFTANVSTLPPVRSMAQQLQSAAAVGHSSAVATVATVTAALESTWGARDRRGAPLPKECQSPTEWFIADDTAAHTRYFVIQGSDNLDHWRVNLTFDPVPFEDPALGIKVHRGVYETAQVLYDRFLPLVQEHLATSPFAKVAFTGHSLGGSLGTLLMLMYVRRGVLPLSAVSPVYTFGAPAIFCEGGCACGSSSGSGSGDQEAGQAEGGSCCSTGAAAAASGSCESSGSGAGVLGALGLPPGAVRNVLMHRDIVPRAFACDYSLVADLLRRVADSFREHACLNADRTVMFEFVGRMMVLQPSAEASFVGGEGHHPMLPHGPGLYLLRDPASMPASGGAEAGLKRSGSFGSAAQLADGAVSNRAAATAAATPAGSPKRPGARAVAAAASSPAASSKPGSSKGQQLQPAKPVTNAREALWELMNNPHPLDILADPGAYGDLGSISRYHNPDNYTRALGRVLHARGARRLAARAAGVGMRHYAPLLDPAAQRAALAASVAGGSSDGGGTAPAPAAAVGERERERHVPPGGKQALLTRLSPRAGSSGRLADQ